MAYTTRYRIQSARWNNETRLSGLTTIDILDSSWGGGITTFKAGKDPLNISFDGNVDSIYDATIGSGAIIQVATTPGTLASLFQYDPQRFMIKIWSGSTVQNPSWQGFVNAQIYQEKYSIPTGSTTTIIINANDGMKVLDSMYYKQSNGLLYTGTTTIGTVLQNCIGKLGLTFNNIYLTSDITTDGNNHNIFTQIKVNQENYFDEKLIPMSCKGVLDSIFGALSLVVSLRGSDIYIQDPYNLQFTGTTYPTNVTHIYDLATFTETTISGGGFLDITNGDIHWANANTQRDVVPLKDEVHIKFDPYTITNYSPDFTDSTMWSNTGSFTHYTTGSPYNIDYYKNNTISYSGWTQSGTTHFLGIEQTQTDTPIYCVLLDGNNSEWVKYTIPYSTINPDSSLSLKISFNAYLQSKVNDGAYNTLYGDDIYSANGKTTFNAYYVPCTITIGGSDIGIGPIPVMQAGVSYAQYAGNNSLSIVNDTWSPGYKIISLAGITSGMITVTFYNLLTNINVTPSYSPGGDPNKYLSMICRRVLIKDLKIEFINSAGVTISNTGVEKIGYVSTNLSYINNATDISTTNGCGVYGTSRGAFLSTSNTQLSLYGLYRDYAVHMSEDLVIQSVKSQYNQPRVKLSGTLNVKNYLLGVRNKLIKDSLMMGTKAFYIVSGTYNDRMETMNVEMVEVPNIRDTLS